jgi:hypothetical protein
VENGLERAMTTVRADGGGVFEIATASALTSAVAADAEESVCDTVGSQLEMN